MGNRFFKTSTMVTIKNLKETISRGNEKNEKLEKENKELRIKNEKLENKILIYEKLKNIMSKTLEMQKKPQEKFLNYSIERHKIADELEKAMKEVIHSSNKTLEECLNALETIE